MKILFYLFLASPVTGFGQARYDVLIHEFMADPSPAVGLPNYEWVELKNVSNTPINIQNWRLADAGSLSGPLPSFILQPDSLVLVCSSGALSSLLGFGNAIAVSSFPSLDNSGDQLSLRSVNGKIIHAISYTDDWYQNALKKEGGWSIEMMDSDNPCAGANNWKASTNSLGGSPGKSNSVAGTNTDLKAPQLLHAYSTDSLTIILVFDEPVDSLFASDPANFSIDNGSPIFYCTALNPLFNQVELKLTIALQWFKVYKVSATNIRDCKGNLQAIDTINVGLASDAAPGEWIINEILFDPRPGGYDFVEFYNNSNKVLDASQLHIASRNSSGNLYSIYPISMEPRLVFPGQHLVITEDRAQLSLHYLVKDPYQVFELPALPSFPDDEGIVVAINGQGAVVDEVAYDKDWHFKLIENTEGISLERIDANKPSQESSNWHSAASTVGFATPGYKNSQHLEGFIDPSAIFVQQKIFSPDNDGMDDYAVIQYKLPEKGYLANIIIYDVMGRPVRHLARNSTLGSTGQWNWDGLDDKGRGLPIGIYIVLTELFNLDGKRQHFKNGIVLARKL